MCSKLQPEQMPDSPVRQIDHFALKETLHCTVALTVPVDQHDDNKVLNVSRLDPGLA